MLHVVEILVYFNVGHNKTLSTSRLEKRDFFSNINKTTIISIVPSFFPYPSLTMIPNAWGDTVKVVKTLAYISDRTF